MKIIGGKRAILLGGPNHGKKFTKLSKRYDNASDAYRCIGWVLEAHVSIKDDFGACLLAVMSLDVTSKTKQELISALEEYFRQ